MVGGYDQVWTPMHAARRKVPAGMDGDNGRIYPLDKGGQFVGETAEYGFHKVR
jgi:hypothetical protein